MRTGYMQRVETAFAALPAEARGRRPSIGIVLGSGLGAFADTVRGVPVGYASIPGLPKPTVDELVTALRWVVGDHGKWTHSPTCPFCRAHAVLRAWEENSDDAA